MHWNWIILSSLLIAQTVSFSNWKDPKDPKNPLDPDDSEDDEDKKDTQGPTGTGDLVLQLKLILYPTAFLITALASATGGKHKKVV